MSQFSEFRGFCKNASDAQLQGIYEKEMSNGREAMAEIARAVAEGRGVEIEEYVESEVVRIFTPELRETLLGKLKEGLAEFDFCGTTMDDAWADDVAQHAPEYVETILEEYQPDGISDNDDDADDWDEMLQDFSEYVNNAFIDYLAHGGEKKKYVLYDIDTGDLLSPMIFGSLEETNRYHNNRDGRMDGVIIIPVWVP